MSMTESEAIEKIKYRIDTAKEVVGSGSDGKAFEDLEFAISAIEELRELKEKATAKKPITHPFLKCPTCNRSFLYMPVKYCYNCGTEFDWSEGKE